MCLSWFPLRCTTLFFLLPVHSTAAPMSSWNADALVNLQEQLMDNVLMKTGLNTKLEKAAGGFMIRSEAQTVTCLPSDREQVGEVIKILRGKSDEEFYTFLKMLRAANYGGWADLLASEAERRRKDAEGASYCS